MLLLLMRRRGSPRVPPGVAACMQVCETERARGGPVHAWARAASRARWVQARGRWVCQSWTQEHRPTLAPQIVRPDATVRIHGRLVGVHTM